MPAPMFSIGNQTFRNLRKMENALKAAKAAFNKKWKKTLDDSGDIAQKYFLRQFGSHGSEFGTPWPQLAAATQKDRARRGYKPTRPMLVRRSWLRASVTSKTSTHHKRTITETGITMESTVTVGGYNLFEIHQKGTNRIPERIMVLEPDFVSEAAWNEIRARMAGMFSEIRIVMEAFF